MHGTSETLFNIKQSLKYTHINLLHDSKSAHTAIRVECQALLLFCCTSNDRDGGIAWKIYKIGRRCESYGMEDTTMKSSTMSFWQSAFVRVNLLGFLSRASITRIKLRLLIPLIGNHMSFSVLKKKKVSI